MCHYTWSEWICVCVCVWQIVSCNPGYLRTLYRLGYPSTHRDHPASPSQVLWLKAWTFSRMYFILINVSQSCWGAFRFPYVFFFSIPYPVSVLSIRAFLYFIIILFLFLFPTWIFLGLMVSPFSFSAFSENSINCFHVFRSLDVQRCHPIISFSYLTVLSRTG